MQPDFNNQFIQDATEQLKQLPTCKEFHYPGRVYLDNGDLFFQNLWKYIDESRNFCWVMTYAMDSSTSANVTLQKLINAAKRGVDVVLFVDDLQQYTNPELVKKLKNNGGLFVSLNPTWRQFWNITNQEFFRRHHEKLVIIDDKAIIGSANIESNYGGVKYGNQKFYDMNYYTSGYINTRHFKTQFQKIAALYNIKLKDWAIPDALPPYYQLLYSHQPNLREIQNVVLESIRNAKECIRIVQPYYYPVRIFEQELIKALERGVKVEIITSAKRDQPVYRYIKNYMLFSRLFHKNLTLYEYPEQLLHMKGYLIDNAKFNFGSFNNDRWSWKLNNEVNILLEDQAEVEGARQIMNKCRLSSREVKQDGSVGPWRYTKIKFWELFIYLSEIMMSKNKGLHSNKYQYKECFASWDDSLGTEF